MGIRDAELEFEVNDTYWLDELDADLAWMENDDWLDDEDWAVGDDDEDEYNEFDNYDDFADWEVDMEDYTA